jgi:hypothetical protein
MVQVMPRVQPQQVADRFLAALLVDTVTIEPARVHDVEQAEPRDTQRSEQPQRGERVPLRILECRGPLVLVERLDWGSRSGQDHADPIRRHDFGIREVRENGGNAPAIRRCRPPEIGVGTGRDQVRDSRRRVAEDLQRVQASDQPGHPFDVLLRCFLHA